MACGGILHTSPQVFLRAVQGRREDLPFFVERIMRSVPFLGCSPEPRVRHPLVLRVTAAAYSLSLNAWQESRMTSRVCIR
jgi:hypothetical protein